MQLPTELPQPLNDDDFERQCIEVYRVVFNDPLPGKNGRRGQAQEGADSYVYSSDEGRIAVQSKRYNRGCLTEQHVLAEVDKAQGGATAIQKLLIATTALSDAPLRRFVNRLSDERASQGLFEVGIDFWDDITAHIRRHHKLQELYEPHAPGALLHRVEAKLVMNEVLAEERHRQIVEEVRLLRQLQEKSGIDKSVDVEPSELGVTLPAKFVTARSKLMYLTLDQLAISLVERQWNTNFERRVTIKTADGELFVDALRQDDDLPADHLLEVRWLRKRYLDAPIWTEQIVSKVKLYELLTGRKVSGTLVFVVPNKLGTLDELPFSRDAISNTAMFINVVMAPYSAIGFDPGPVSAAVFASNTKWTASKIEIDPLR